MLPLLVTVTGWGLPSQIMYLLCTYLFWANDPIIPKPEFFGDFGGDSLTKPPFGVTSAEVAIPVDPRSLEVIVGSLSKRSPTEFHHPFKVYGRRTAQRCGDWGLVLEKCEIRFSMFFHC